MLIHNNCFFFLLFFLSLLTLLYYPSSSTTLISRFLFFFIPLLLSHPSYLYWPLVNAPPCTATMQSVKEIVGLKCDYVHLWRWDKKKSVACHHPIPSAFNPIGGYQEVLLVNQEWQHWLCSVEKQSNFNVQHCIAVWHLSWMFPVDTITKLRAALSWHHCWKRLQSCKWPIYSDESTLIKKIENTPEILQSPLWFFFWWDYDIWTFFSWWQS